MHCSPRLAPAGAALMAALAGGACSDTVRPTDVAARITIAPASATLETGAAVALDATVTDGGGRTLHDRVVFWDVSDTAVARVSQRGLVTGVRPGTALVAASCDGKSAVVTITVVPPRVASVTVEPSTVELRAGGTARLEAIARDAVGSRLDGRAVTWSSSNERVATVGATGLVSAHDPGTAIVYATIEGQSGSARVLVRPPAADAATRIATDVATLTPAPTAAASERGRAITHGLGVFGVDAHPY